MVLLSAASCDLWGGGQDLPYLDRVAPTHCSRLGWPISGQDPRFALAFRVNHRDVALAVIASVWRTNRLSSN
jgi:hypothetical protein